MRFKQHRRSSQSDIMSVQLEAAFREEFRKQAISHGVADDCVIDKEGYAEISCVTGCFKRDHLWIVYDTDEKSEIFREKKYENIAAAYADVADRLGFIFDTHTIKNTQLASAVVSQARPMYDFSAALQLVCASACAKFDETVELHIKLGVDCRRADQQVRGTVILPHGTGKIRRVLVFAQGSKAEEAKTAGADFVGGVELADKIQRENWYNFDTVVATPDMMGIVGRLGKLLGPKGLMPSPKSGTVTPNVARAVVEIKTGKIEYRLDRTNIIHCPIGKVSFGPKKLTDNSKVLMDAIIKAKPSTTKGQYVQSCFAVSTMGKSVKINID